MSGNSSFGQILRSSSIIGGATAINVLIGLFRTKIAALLLGPAGVGLIGLFLSTVSTGTALFGLGLNTATVRQLAGHAAREDERALAVTRRALLWMTLGLGILAAVAFWLLREPLAKLIIGRNNLSGSIGLLGIAVALSIAASSQLALLNGFRRIGDIARVNVGGAFLGTAIGVAVLLLWGDRGMLAYVVAAPLAGVIVGWLLVRRLPPVARGTADAAAIRAASADIARIGSMFMLASVATTGTILAVRAIIAQSLGETALGQATAAWMISMTGIGFVLQAMATDYLPRLAAVIDDPVATNRAVNEQTEVALILAAPILIMLEGGAPWIIHLLYSSKFGDAAPILQWQVLGDALKIALWPLGFILVAGGRSRTFLGLEILGNLIFVGAVRALLPLIGVEAASLGYLTMYVLSLPIYYWAVRRRGFRWSRSALLTAVLLFGVLVCIRGAHGVSPLIGAGAGALCFIASGIFALKRLSHLSGRGGWMPGSAFRRPRRGGGSPAASSGNS